MELTYAKNSKEEVPFGLYMEQYAAMDPKEAAKRLQIPYDEEKQLFTISMLQQPYEVSWPDLTVRHVDSREGMYYAAEVEIPAKIFFLRYLLQGVSAESTGRFLTYREVPSGEVYFRQFSGRCLSRLAFGFGFKPDRFAVAMEALGAKKLEHGDVSYEIEFINRHFVRFILWIGDDEFPPSAQMLFSDNFPMNFTPEDLAVVGDISINTMKKIN
ncbi:MAG: DUF3786 domain-containing protein [Eubacteriales bacterium]|nr:DUF3786 domain-containing protein [Eubacteriales bacterium]